MAFYIFLIQKKQNYISMLKDSVTKRTKSCKYSYKPAHGDHSGFAKQNRCRSDNERKIAR